MVLKWDKEQSKHSSIGIQSKAAILSKTMGDERNGVWE